MSHVTFGINDVVVVITSQIESISNTIDFIKWTCHHSIGSFCVYSGPPASQALYSLCRIRHNQGYYIWEFTWEFPRPPSPDPLLRHKKSSFFLPSFLFFIFYLSFLSSANTPPPYLIGIKKRLTWPQVYSVLLTTVLDMVSCLHERCYEIEK